MSTPTIHKHTINDVLYTCIPHHTSEALPIVTTLLSALPGPLMTAFNSVREDMAEKGQKSLLDIDLQEALGSVDLSKLGPDVSKAIRDLGSDPALIQLVFKRTTRDGKQLGKSHEFDAAFAGNWVEFYQALLWVIKVNGFIPLSFTSDAS